MPELSHLRPSLGDSSRGALPMGVTANTPPPHLRMLAVLGVALATACASAAAERGHQDTEEGAHVEPHAQGHCDPSAGETCAEAVATLTVGALAEDLQPPQSLQARLEEATPAGLARGFNDLRVRLLDMGGAPLEATTVSARPWMPDHGHGTPVPPSARFDPAGQEWVVEDIDLFMAGYWRVYLFACNESVDTCCDERVAACPSTSASLMDTLFFETWINE